MADDKWIGAADGHFEEGEMNDPKACVLRELKEEMAVTEAMLSDLQLRYITMRKVPGEIRQNYYFFAKLEKGLQMELASSEGELQWFEPEELSGLEMPFTAKFMMEHYLETGRFNNHIYVGAADGEKVVFTQLG